MIPCCFHPTRVAIVNDSHELKTVLHDHMPKSHMTCEFFNSPNKALHYINEVYQPEPFYDRYKSNNDVRNDQESRKTSRPKTQAVDTHHEIYRPQRFDEISTIVIDYLPSSSLEAFCPETFSKMTGLEFFEQVKNPHLQKIILIEEEHKEIANQALKHGLIQYVICKQDLDWEDNFCEALQDAQWQYFNKLSEIFINTIRPGAIKEYALDDPNFQKFFKSILMNYGFTEAYLCESTGSYLFLDDQAQDHGLVVNIADQLDKWVLTGQARGISHSLLKALKERKKMMCYHSHSDGVEPDKSHWDIYAHPAKTIRGRQSTYYYAFAPNMYDIDVERILPFEEYRESQQKKVASVH